jgi:hypothetical protein
MPVPFKPILSLKARMTPAAKLQLKMGQGQNSLRIERNISKEF